MILNLLARAVWRMRWACGCVDRALGWVGSRLGRGDEVVLMVWAADRKLWEIRAELWVLNQLGRAAARERAVTIRKVMESEESLGMPLPLPEGWRVAQAEPDQVKLRIMRF